MGRKGVHEGYLLVGKPEGGRGGVDNNKIDPREIGWGGMDWIDLAQDRDQWRALMNTVIPWGSP
jgi:hypothetical protein